VGLRSARWAADPVASTPSAPPSALTLQAVQAAAPEPAPDVVLQAAPAGLKPAPASMDPSVLHRHVPVASPRTRSVLPALATDGASVQDKLPLAGEVALVQQAARALAGGEPAVALAVLEAYQGRYPSGVLREEAGLLRVQALAGSGDRERARALARRILDEDPHGVLAPRLRAAVGDGIGP
jgi:hypothetical protein